MRAAVYQGHGKPLAISNVSDPAPGAGQVVVKVGRCGICGSDLHMAEGHLYSFAEGDVPGHEFAGEVVALGKGVEKIKMGDRVAVMPFISCGHCKACLSGKPSRCLKNKMLGSSGIKGGFAEYALADAAWCVRLPATLGFDDGALVEPLAVSLRANICSGIKAGDKVLVIGAGAIGIAAAYWARKSGAGAIAVSATSTRRENMAYAVGINSFITPQAGLSLAQQTVAALGAEADIVFECAGVPGSLDAAVSAVRRGGVVVAPGFCWSPDTFSPMMAMLKEATIKFTNVYDLRDFEIAVDTLDRGNVEPRAMITEVVDLDAVPQTFELLKASNSHCKIQISPWA
ncbi:MAG: alcohol dehydrogenase catalytic domain-containing protein [Spongiibacteraceae bacterium]